MKNGKTEMQQYIGKMSSIFKWLYLIFILLFDNSIVYDTTLTKCFSKVLIIMGTLIILWRILSYKEYVNYPYIVLYGLFLATFVLTGLLNFRYGYLGNLKLLIWMTFQFFILYLFDREKNTGIKHEYIVCLIIIIIYTTIVNAIGIRMLFTNFSQERLVENNQRLLLIGVAYWGRLFGVHTDPNYGAVLSIIAIMCALYIVFKYKHLFLKIIMGITMFVQIVYLSFSASRTGLVCVCVALGSFFLLYNVLMKNKIGISIVCSLVAICTCLVFVKIIPAAYNSYVDKLEKSELQTESTVVQGESKTSNDVEPESQLAAENTLLTENNNTDSKNTELPEVSVSETESSVVNEHNDKKEEQLTKIGRKNEIKGDISNRRFDLWKNGIQTFLKSPIIGIGFGNIIQYSKANLPNCYLLNNDLGTFGSYHNFIIDLLVSQGIVGFILFIIIMIHSLRFIIINFNKIDESHRLMFAFLMSTCACIFCSNMFTSGILYCNNETTVIFWLLWGYLINMMHKLDK